MEFGKTLAEFPAAHAGHDDVGDEQIDVVTIGGGCDGGFAGCGFDNGVALGLQDAAEEKAEVVLIFDEEKSFRAGLGKNAGEARGWSGGLLFDLREEKGERGAFAGSAAD